LIWLLPAALSSIAIALILKVNEGRGGNRILIAGANYLVASAISFVLLAAHVGPAADSTAGAVTPVLGGLARPEAATLILGAAAGVVYVLGFLLLMASIARLPLAVPVTIARLSVVLPVALSIVLWAEKPELFQWIGIALGLVAIALFGMSFSGSGGLPRANARSWPLIGALFIVLGCGDTLLKAFRETAPDADRLTFTFVLFTVAAAFTWLLVLARRVRFDANTFGLGVLLGVPNLFSTVFTLRALRSVPASIAFPFINLTVIAGSTLLGLAVWRERLRRMSMLGLLVAALAIVFLSLR
jgi:drug/metabolite transporter (DMT)-like permease